MTFTAEPSQVDETQWSPELQVTEELDVLLETALQIVKSIIDRCEPGPTRNDLLATSDKLYADFEKAGYTSTAATTMLLGLILACQETILWVVDDKTNDLRAEFQQQLDGLERQIKAIDSSKRPRAGLPPVAKIRQQATGAVQKFVSNNNTGYVKKADREHVAKAMSSQPKDAA